MKTNRRKTSNTLTKIMSSITEEDKRRTRDRMLIAVKIADVLESRGLSQKAFAKMMKKNESEISEWLSGNRNFTVDTLSDIGNCLGVDLLQISDIRTKNIPTGARCRKVKNTRSPSIYTMSWHTILSLTTKDYCASNNYVFAIN